MRILCIYRIRSFFSENIYPIFCGKINPTLTHSLYSLYLLYSLYSSYEPNIVVSGGAMARSFGFGTPLTLLLRGRASTFVGLVHLLRGPPVRGLQVKLQFRTKGPRPPAHMRRCRFECNNFGSQHLNTLCEGAHTLSTWTAGKIAISNEGAIATPLVTIYWGKAG